MEEEYNFERRCKESKNIIKKYPDRIPIIVKKVYNSDIPIIYKNRYLVPKHLTISEFICILRKKINLSKEKSIIIYADNTVLSCCSTIDKIYEEYKSPDDFLYLYYSGENTFG